MNSPQMRMSDDAQPAAKVIRKWPSVSAFARAVGKAPSTTHRWLANGWFPNEEIPGIVAALKREFGKADPLDFVDLTSFSPEWAPKPREDGTIPAYVRTFDLGEMWRYPVSPLVFCASDLFEKPQPKRRKRQ